MFIYNLFLRSSNQSLAYKNNWQRFHLDPVLLCGLLILISVGLVVLYSASSEDFGLVVRQIIRLSIALIVMIVVAQISPTLFKLWAPWLFSLGILLLLTVLLIGVIGKGAQRWLNLGIVNFQPSELMKLALPMMLAWFFSDCLLPPSFSRLLGAGVLILTPVILTAKQPDLGTALMIASAGVSVIFLAGVSWYFISTICLLAAAGAPILWHFMHNYQRQRVLTFLNPERDPLGSGYHIIQSKIAIGSGGLFGKGWLQGTQSHLDFLPEHATDFIFAVAGEEFGLLGACILVLIYLFIILRGIYITNQAQDTFTRLLAGSLITMFFMSVFVNMGMVMGILPVVGLPLPLVSYGGTSMVTLMAGFGILMSIHTHRNLLSKV
ncbi:MAG: rod shape-determining protein RodA [Gammaproteobacteria bacterium]